MCTYYKLIIVNIIIHYNDINFLLLFFFCLLLGELLSNGYKILTSDIVSNVFDVFSRLHTFFFSSRNMYRGSQIFLENYYRIVSDWHYIFLSFDLD